MRIIVGVRLPEPPDGLEQGANRDAILDDFLRARRARFAQIVSQVVVQAAAEFTRSSDGCSPLSCPNLGIIVMQAERDEASRISHLDDVAWVNEAPDVSLLIEPTGTASGDAAVVSQALIDLRIPELWNVSEATGIIGHIDCGIRPQAAPHAFDGVIACFKRFGECGEPVSTTPSDEHGHGTLSAALLAARPFGGWQLGAAPRFRLVSAAVPLQPVRMIYPFAAALDWCLLQKCRVISASVGKDGMRDGIRDIVVRLRRMGVLLVAPAGNSGDKHTCYPGNYPESLSVGACHLGGYPMGPMSSHGTAYGQAVPDLVAPGVDVLSIGLNGVVTEVSGTCFSTPLIAGILSILAASFPRQPLEVVESALFQSCALGELQAVNANRGLPDARKAYDILASMP